MVGCSVTGCRNRTNKKTDSQKDKEKKFKVSFHRFPEETKLREVWISAVQRKNWSPTKYSTVCSDHFEENCFDESPFYRKLKPTAIPTKYPLNYYIKPLKPEEDIEEIYSTSERTHLEVNVDPQVSLFTVNSLPAKIISKTTSFLISQHYSQCKYKLLGNYKFKCDEYRKKIKILQQQNRRYVKRITKLQLALKEFKSKTCINKESNNTVINLSGTK